jgi:ElaB/YqjD/DUF883 family membrane-anchored ribosome-binding protein
MSVSLLRDFITELDNGLDKLEDRLLEVETATEDQHKLKTSWAAKVAEARLQVSVARDKVDEAAYAFFNAADAKLENCDRK